MIQARRARARRTQFESLALGALLGVAAGLVLVCLLVLEQTLAAWALFGASALLLLRHHLAEDFAPAATPTVLEGVAPVAPAVEPRQARRQVRELYARLLEHPEPVVAAFEMVETEAEGEALLRGFIAWCGRQAPAQAEPALVACLEASQTSVAAAAIAVLADVGSPAMVPPLLTVSGRLWPQASRALEAIRARAPETAPPAGGVAPDADLESAMAADAWMSSDGLEWIAGDHEPDTCLMVEPPEFWDAA